MPSAKNGTPTSTALVRAGGSALAVQSVDDLERLATLLYKGGCTPPGIDNPAKCAAVILAGLEVGLTPTQALGSIMLTNGRLSIYGDAALALVRASGLLAGISEELSGSGDERKAVCSVVRKGEQPREFKFSMAEAKQAGLIARANGKGPWATYPDRMLTMRARGFALRDVFPDVLRGLTTYEEVADHDAAAPPVQVQVRQADPPKAAGSPPAVETGAAVPDAEVRELPPAVAEPPPDPAHIPAKVTAEQLTELARLRSALFIGRGVKTDDEKAAAWRDVLADYHVSSAKELSGGQAVELIDHLRKLTDPFSHPHSSAASPT